LQVRIRIPSRNRLTSAPADRQQPLSPNISTLAPAPPASKKNALGASSAVALGILLSRIVGFVRESVFGYYFGVETIPADAFRAAIRIPNLLSNLFGEGVLSASFVTVYAKLRAKGEDEDAEHLAAAVFGILTLVCAVLVLLGITAAPLLIDIIAFGFEGPKRLLTVTLVRILFPATGLLVMSAWCLGVLNSHRKFLLSYLAPVALSVAVIVVNIAAGQSATGNRLVIDVAWGWVLGSLLQFLVQLPNVLALLPGFRPRLDVRSPHVRTVLRNFGPVFISRGVVQISAWIDQMIASELPLGAVSALGYGQVIAILPVSLFSMSVSAAELPTLSSATGTPEEIAEFLRGRLAKGLRRIAFFIVPSAVAFLLLGDVVIAVLYQRGKFQRTGVEHVWAVLAGSAVGLLATSLGRLYSSAFYALLDTKTPLRFAFVRVTLTAVLGVISALLLPHWLGIDPKWGVAGLTASAGVAGWVEFLLLRHALAQRIGDTSLSPSFTIRLWSVAISAATVAYFIKLGIGINHPYLLGCLALPVYGALYFAGTALLGIAESRATIESVTRRFGLNF
jgi:putative peptidoglycan lipid II flippase